ncbi:TIGR03936 family radical SAM-associated protein [Tissierella creatinophila]|uniref:DUF2344 domain-containing protein n=1 Tax=Tissierella creatinophila DSM 6911 TaxID=1123403 RepID=A0A1U7M7P3_TISCR|nr:TIGR03936 family radical SAM-associated protein [Tissierella creatinophila]OLS03332.1 hypothetical protein TICRE_06710 [Tissierella creatinophila DSM 6911]
MKFRIKFNKKNYLKYISHLDLMRLFERTFNRIDAPIEYSQGFNPKPKISIASPLSLGIESEEEWMDIELLEKVDEKDFIKNVNSILPSDIQILETEYIEDNTPIAALINWSVYEIYFLLLEDKKKIELENIIEDWLKQEEILIERYRKKGRNKILVTENIIELMKDIELKSLKNNEVVLKGKLKIGESGTLRPRDFINAFIADNNLNIDIDSISFKRISQII